MGREFTGDSIDELESDKPGRGPNRILVQAAGFHGSMDPVGRVLFSAVTY